MSYIYTVDVQCDVCWDWIDGSTGQGAKKRAREAARNSGWKFKDGQHTCKKCIAAGRDHHSEERARANDYARSGHAADCPCEDCTYVAPAAKEPPCAT